MIRIKQVMAFARAQRLINRRLVRYWFFLGMAYFFTISIYIQFSVRHGMNLESISPRFILSTFGLYYLIIFLVGAIFLAFDIRARDKREMMIEVLDSRPYSNLELVTGRFVGVFLSSWIPIALLALFLKILGSVLHGLDLPVGEPIETFSLFSFIFLMAIPALSFVISLVLFVTLLVRNRLAAAVILLGIIGILYWALFMLPSIYGGMFDIIGIYSMIYATDIVPMITSPEGWIQRFSVLFAAFGLLGFSAAVHPRLESGTRLRLTAGSIVIIVVALSLGGAVYFKNTNDIRMIETWKSAHAAYSYEVFPDIKKIEGNIKIVPGKDLFLDLDLTFGTPNNGSLKNALFSLNPGQKVKSINDSSGKSITFTNENGLVEVSLPQPMGPGEEATIHLIIEGLPDNRFAYMDSAASIKETSFSQANFLLLGYNSGIFDKAFVALTPGLRWLPASGPEKDRSNPGIRALDYFNVDLKVDLPGGWLIAGPGKRYKLEGNSDGVSFRFSPPAQVPEVALIGSMFESRAMEVEGVTLEILMHKKHTKNLEILADTKGKIKEWVGARLKETEEYGLGYPYDGITLVEVPNKLRGYGGGWRMDTVMAPPGMLLIREMGFPTSRFDSAFRNPEIFRNRLGGIQQAKWERLKAYFTNDFSGGDLLTGISRNFFLYQASTKGPEGTALHYIMESLSNLLIGETRCYFSVYSFIETGRLGLLRRTTAAQNSIDSRRRVSVVDEAMDVVVSRPEIWDYALGVSFEGMDPWENPDRNIDVMTLKANAIAQSILDTLGREKTGILLGSIRKKYKGKAFSLSDMVDIGKTLDCNLEEILGDWFSSTDMPGFVCERAISYRIPDSEDGTPRYQMLFTIRNDEHVPGNFRMIYEYIAEGEIHELIKSATIHLDGKSAIQYGTIVSRLPHSVFLEPYLSLNRKSFSLQLDRWNDEKIKNVDPIEGIKVLTYSIPLEASIVVDDLDPGFDAIKEVKDSGLRVNTREYTGPTDQGLPMAFLFSIPSDWSRMENFSGYGKYRHTLAVIGSGKGEKKAVFTTAIKHAGQWTLEIYMPQKESIWPIYPGKRWGVYHLIITDSNGHNHEINFYSNASSSGWNLVYDLNLPQGETTVTISNKTDGRFVVADAIKWSPSGVN